MQSCCTFFKSSTPFFSAQGCQNLCFNRLIRLDTRPAKSVKPPSSHVAYQAAHCKSKSSSSPFTAPVVFHVTFNFLSLSPKSCVPPARLCSVANVRIDLMITIEDLKNLHRMMILLTITGYQEMSRSLNRWVQTYLSKFRFLRRNIDWKSNDITLHDHVISMSVSKYFEIRTSAEVLLFYMRLSRYSTTNNLFDSFLWRDRWRSRQRIFSKNIKIPKISPEWLFAVPHSSMHVWRSVNRFMTSSCSSDTYLVITLLRISILTDPLENNIDENTKSMTYPSPLHRHPW